MRKLILTIPLFFIVPSLYPQRNNGQTDIDSLKVLLAREAKEDTLMVARLNTLTGYLIVRNADSAMPYADRALRLAEKLNFENGIAVAYLRFSSIYKTQGDFVLALDYLQKAKRKYAKLRSKITLGYAEANLNNTQGDYRSALNFYLGYQLPKVKGIFNYSSVGNFLFIADSYNGLNKPDSALYYLRKIPLASLKVFDNMPWFYNITGDAWLRLKQTDSSLFYYKLALDYSIPGETSINTLASSLGLAKVFLSRGQPDSGILYAFHTLNDARSGSFRDFALKALRILAEANEKIDPAASIRYYKMAAALNDSIYGQQKIRQVQNLKYTDELRKREAEEKERQNKAEIQRYLLISGLSAFVFISLILIRNNRQKQKANAKIEKAFAELRETQQQLIQSEKMASLGELTAGIAHEIQNPLNFVNNFSDLNKELLVEMNDEIDKGNINEVKGIAKNIIDNEEKINNHGKRADAIVKAMLQHSRSSGGVKEPADINVLADEYLRLAYHGLRAKDKSFNATMRTDFDQTIGKINIIPQDIGRVILNLITNAFYVVDEKKKQRTGDYEPIVSVSTRKTNKKVEISVKDNGNGIPEKVLDKIFQPFFTTKPAGQGTGLGLSLSYDIVKAHGGELKVQNKEGEGAEFIITLPC